MLLEHEECKILADWLRYKNLKFTHVANEGKFPVQYRMKLKSLGVSPGVPDYMIIVPQGLLFIEMKRLKGRVSDYQKEWIKALSECDGVEATVCYGADEAITFISEYL